MKRFSKIVAACCGCAIGVASLVVLAEEKKPATQPAMAGMPDMATMMAKMQEAATPGKMHEWLTSQVGTWEGKVTAWMMPDAPPSHSTCTMTVKSLIGGR